MKLKSFSVHDYRSINDSGEIEVEQRTALVGRNESGKSSLLKVLFGLKPAPGGQMLPLTLARDFPRDRSRRSFDEKTTVLKTQWVLDSSDRAALVKIWPRGGTTEHAEIERPYAGLPRVSLSPVISFQEVAAPGRQLVADIKPFLERASTREASPTPIPAQYGELVSAVEKIGEGSNWGTDVLARVGPLRQALSSTGAILPEVEVLLGKVENLATAIANDKELWVRARSQVIERMPMFVYLDEWDEVPGHHNIPSYIQRKVQSQLNANDRLFEKLLKVAELDAQELQTLLTQNHEERTLLTNRAGRVLTTTLRGLWKDREISVEFRVDAEHFDVLVSDKDTDALVPLDERSRGFRWYFSFFITFAADTQGGDKSNAVLLLDEPGLFLHATAQASLLKLFETFPNQIIYSTHSPFMIDSRRMGSVRTVNLRPGEGTIVSNSPTGDANTLFPLQAALGYDLTQTLFVGSENVVVEGVTDYWYLDAASDFLKEQGKTGLKRGLVLTPAGGAQKVPYMSALLAAQHLSVVVLLDSEPASATTAKEMIQQKIIRDDAVVFIGAAFSSAPTAGADVEDLLEADSYKRLVEESYARELDGKAIPWDDRIGRIVLRAEAALKNLGITFHKTRPARLFLQKMATAPASLITAAASERFERLFRLLNEAVERVAKREPFT
jgi:energy-coupling factor transporter ATP-binding protein EcfA2